MTKEEIILAAATDVAILTEPQLSEQNREEFVEFFTEDMQAIMQFVEEKTKKKYSFRNGRLLMYFKKEQGTAIWEDD